MLRHCSTATATESLMLLLRLDVVFGMIMEHEERHSTQTMYVYVHTMFIPLDGMNVDFVQPTEKVLLSLCCS